MGDNNDTEHGDEVEVFQAVLFPFFAEALGIMTLWLLSRLAPHVPYTVVMFVEGVIMGITYTLREGDDELSESTSLWVNINSELLLLIFLPALLFGDALGLNYFLFKKAFWQANFLAFPGVLLGTGLTALVVKFVFPYDWSLFLSLTVGSILSATDPVAVSALLAELGAPPRLQMLVTGESMLNDGAAIVFFTVFSEMYLFEKDVEGLGEEFTFGSGVTIFLRMSLGGTLIGLAFGFLLVLVLRVLGRRLSETDHILQVSASITTAYLSYYVADVVAGTSGVLAVVFAGVTASAFGTTHVHHLETLRKTWEVIEYLGNTLLFFLGGVIFGSIVSDDDRAGSSFGGEDWGYLVLLYVMLVLIRVVVVGAAYPVVANIGLGVNVPEAAFMVWGGLRGAVGIALALSLDNEVRDNVPEDGPGGPGTAAREETARVFVFVGGMALLTLVVNAPSAAWVLRRLGLTGTSNARLQVVKSLFFQVRLDLLDVYVHLHAQERYQRTDFGLVQHHIALFAGVTDEELELAKRRVRIGEVEAEHERGDGDGDRRRDGDRERDGDSDRDRDGEGAAWEEREERGEGGEGDSEALEDGVEPELNGAATKIGSGSDSGGGGGASTAPEALGAPAASGDGGRPASASASPSASVRHAISESDAKPYSHLLDEEEEAEVANLRARRVRSLDSLPREPHGRGRDRAMSASSAGRAGAAGGSGLATSARQRIARFQSMRGTFHKALPEAQAAEFRRLVRKGRRASRPALGGVRFFADAALLPEGAAGDSSFESQVTNLREVFLSIMRAAYWRMLQRGELAKGSFTAYALLQSLDVAANAVAKGKPAGDWEAVNIVQNTVEARVEAVYVGLLYNGIGTSREARAYQQQRADTAKALAFIEAHRTAEEEFRCQLLSEDDELSRAEQLVLDESAQEKAKAKLVVEKTTPAELTVMLSHILSAVLLNRQGHLIEKDLESGLLTAKEAQSLMQGVDTELDHVRFCSIKHHAQKKESA